MGEETIRAGVVGAGVFGGHHAAKLAEAGALRAVYDADAGRADALAGRHGARGFGELPAFLDAVDAVVVAAPATRHADLAVAAIEAGRHVLVEKPLALTLADADGLIEAARTRGLVLQVGHQEGYVAGALGLLDRAEPSLLVRSRRLNRPSGRAGDVSVVLDLMVHDLHLLARLAGTDEAVVTALAARGPRGAADLARVELSVGRVKAALAASRLEEAPIRDLRVEYASGHVALDFLTRRTEDTTDAPLATTLDSDDAPLALRDPLAYGTARFLSAVRGEGPPGVTGEEGRAALRLALAVEDAVREELS